MFSNLQPVEIFGYIASVLVAVSLMMSAIVKLRVINLIGAFFFSAYGFLIGAYPVGVLNGFIALVDIYYLVEIFSTKEYFRLLEVSPESEYIKYFLDFHSKDIMKFIPSFDFQATEKSDAFFVLRNSVPAGLVLADILDDGSLYVKLDYAIPGYRDFKLGKYVFPKILHEKEIKKVYSDPGNKKHEQYLKKIGFVKTDLNANPIYCLSAKSTN
jgi:hypothetical protein